MRGLGITITENKHTITSCSSCQEVATYSDNGMDQLGYRDFIEIGIGQQCATLCPDCLLKLVNASTQEQIERSRR